MPATQPHHVVIGASAAGVSAALAMRASGFQGRISLIDASPHLPYERPPLSKTFSGGLRPIVGEQAYADNDVELRLGVRVTGLAAGTRTVIAAAYPVADTATAVLMPELHRGLLAGVPAGRALATASASTGVHGFVCLGAD